MRKLLILGSDYGTIQVVREAHKLGMYVIVADLMLTSPTKELADEAWLPSSTDTDTLVQKCKNENITALMFGASDFIVWNARDISDKEIIVERQLHGKEYNVHYALADGRARLLYFSSTHHEPGEAENLYSFKCTTSCHLKQYIEEVNDSVIRAIEKAECREGIVWFDCIRDDDGHFYMLEMGYRFGGVMTYVPYERVTGFNTVRWMLECALGIKHTEQDLPPALDKVLTGCAASYNLFSQHDGEIAQIEGLSEIEKIPGVFVDIPKREGNSVRLHACMGLLGIYGKDIEEVCDRLQMVNSLLRTTNTSGENMFIYFDDYDSLRQEYYKGLEQFK